MILGRKTHIHSSCFDEINYAVEEMTFKPGIPEDRELVVFNAHMFPTRVPPNAIIYNLENVGLQVNADTFPVRRLWDFSKRNCERWVSQCGVYGVEYVPVGYHPSMERFMSFQKDIDVVFSGTLNERRIKVLDEMRALGLNVQVVPHTLYGRGRDEYLSRAKLALNMLYYEDGTFPALRVAHLVANRVPVLSEVCNEGWDFIEQVPVHKLAKRAAGMIRYSDLEREAELAYQAFRNMPMELPL